METKTILIVDDEKSYLTTLGVKLQRAGYKVLTASNGEEGLITAIQMHPDLILLDIIMPTMEGVKMLKELRKDVWGKKAKVIFLTNLTNEEKEAQAKTEGALDYIIKMDMSLQDVLQLVKKNL